MLPAKLRLPIVGPRSKAWEMGRITDKLMGPPCPLFQQIPLRSLLPLCFCLLEAAGPCSHCVGRLKGFGGTMRQRCQQPGSAQSPQRGFSRRRAQNRLRHSGRHRRETCSPLPEKSRLPGPSLQSFELRLLDIFLSGMKNPDSRPSSLRPRSVHSPSSPLGPYVHSPAFSNPGGQTPTLLSQAQDTHSQTSSPLSTDRHVQLHGWRPLLCLGGDHPVGGSHSNGPLDAVPAVGVLRTPGPVALLPGQQVLPTDGEHW